jgi:3'(2'),5'-bisphosphate nucleotidase
MIEAAEAILAVRKRGAKAEKKADQTPVTEADRAAEAIIFKHLATFAPGVPVIAEEACAAGHIPAVGGAFFLVDPLDGTREFVKGGNDFTVNIGLIRDRLPVLGLVLAPATGDLYGGVAGGGAWTVSDAFRHPSARHPIAVRPAPADGMLIVASKSHRTPETDAYIARYPAGGIVAAGSSLKFCTLAEGKADLYPRLGTTMQWDTAAGDAILRAAGGKVVTMDGAALRYGPGAAAGAEAYRNPWFVAAADATPLR